ncbi:MAG: ATP-binding cassette domain-containing protein [Planctomycetes bacterium]|nr:ATP-binding cassette domain-containing protein [Planctomycetota bacterium]
MIVLENVAVRAGTFGLSGISLEIPAGHYGVLMGRTACGKTTILETLCGLKPVRAGRIFLDGREATHLKAAERGIGYVPQDGALFSTMTVRRHLSFALEIRRAPREAIDARVIELARLLGLEGLLDREPAGLSGGEQQRVALGRALSARPKILCLDEPLGCLDEDTHDEICTLLQRVCRELAVTTLHVTHSMNEARRLADCIFRIENGAIARVAG